MYSDILAERVHELKETRKGVDIMCKEMDMIYREGIQAGVHEGEAKARRETALSLARMGMPAGDIAQAVSVSVQCVQEWLSENAAQV